MAATHADMNAVLSTDSGPGATLTWSPVGRPSPGPGEVLVKVVAAGVNRADLMQLRGHYPPPAGASDVLGLEVSGTVVEVGPATPGPEVVAHSFHPRPEPAVGDEVVALLAGGGYAEYVVAPVAQVLPAPRGIDLVTAAGLIETAATVVSNFIEAGVRKHSTVLVHGGSGGVGAMAIGFLRQRRCTVLTTASAANHDDVRALGADHVIDHAGDWAGAVRAAAPDGVDAVLDVMGASHLSANLDVLATGGTLIVIGLQGGARAELDLGQLVARRLRVVGTNVRGRDAQGKAQLVQWVWESMWPRLQAGSIRLPRITRVPIAEAGRALALLESGESSGKIVLTVGE